MQKDLLKQAKANGYTKENGFKQVGIVLNDLTGSQVAYLAIARSNKWLKDNLGANISVFYEDAGYPCITPEFARFNIRDTVFFTGDLICTSFKNVLATKNAACSKRYYYINDLEWTRSWFQFNKQQFEEVMLDDNIVKFTRCKDYYNLLTKNGIKVHPTIVQDFDIDQIMEVIRGNSK